MPAYVISDTNPKDPEAWKAYVSLAPAAIKQYGGRYLSRGGEIDVIEGEWNPRAIVLIEFPDMAAAKTWYTSPEYARALVYRDKALKRNLIFIEGYEASHGEKSLLLTESE